MKKQSFITILLTVLMSMVGAKAFAHDIKVENADGVTIYYNYGSDGTELIVTHKDNFNTGVYRGAVVIPEEVTYMNRTRKVTSIGEGAFAYCSGLTSVTVPSSVKTIGEKAFYYSKNLTSVTIGNSVTSIGESAFEDCSSLTSLIIPNSVTSIGENAFGGCSSLTSVTIPNNVTTIGRYTFGGCSRLTSVTIPNSVTSIGDYAFSNCSSLTSVTIPNSVTSFGQNAFIKCSSLSSVTIGNSVTSIGRSTFESCSRLISVTIGNSVTSIGSYAFYNCSSLTSVTIPNSVISIGASSFNGCSSLSSVTIGNSVTSIGSYAFLDCNLPVVISLIENPFNIGGCFSINTINNATLYVPLGTIDKYKATPGWKNFLFIEEGTGPGGGGETPETKKCATPTIGYKNGKLTFNCDTEGATCQSTITDTDITSYSSNEVQLGVTYNICVYATKAGYENSDVATATLCWIDVEPKTEGITNIVSNVRARAILIQSSGSQLTISGAEEGTAINVFDISGRLAGSTKASSEITTLNTSLQSGDIGIVKIGDKAVKILAK